LAGGHFTHRSLCLRAEALAKVGVTSSGM